MPYRICKTIEIESGHMLSTHPDKCRFPHGHSRKVEFIIESDDLDASGMVCDFKIIKQSMGEWLDELFDHSLCMNRKDPMFDTMKKAYGERIVEFDIDPTTEVLAKTFFDAGKSALNDFHNRYPNSLYTLRSSVRLVRVRVWETSSSWAEYEE